MFGTKGCHHTTCHTYWINTLIPSAYWLTPKACKIIIFIFSVIESRSTQLESGKGDKTGRGEDFFSRLEDPKAEPGNGRSSWSLSLWLYLKSAVYCSLHIQGILPIIVACLKSSYFVFMFFKKDNEKNMNFKFYISSS